MTADVQMVFEQAMGIMDELNAEGQARTADTEEYVHRTPAIVNAMVAELKMLTGDTRSWTPVESLEDSIGGVDTTYALGAMSFGLAAKLLVDENPAAASFYHQKYEEAKRLYVQNRPAQTGEIENIYGGNEHGEFSRW